MFFTDSTMFHIKVASYDDLDTMLIKGGKNILDYHSSQKVVNEKYDFYKHNTFTHIFLFIFLGSKASETYINHTLYIYLFLNL